MRIIQPPRHLACLCTVIAAAAALALAADKEKFDEPAIITPGAPGTPASAESAGKAPSDAVVLFDGKNLSKWTTEDGKPAPWKVAAGVATSGGASIISKPRFTDAQIHVEFALPATGPGNSGLYIHRLYEIQIVNSYDKNPYAPGQQCGALYKVHNPLANACRPPRQWQTYDIIFHGARLDAAGKIAAPARFTVFLNGVLIQDNKTLGDGTGSAKGHPIVAQGPLLLQFHGDPVKFRNIWLRPLHDQKTTE